MRLNSVCGRWMNGWMLTWENRSTQRKTVAEHCVHHRPPTTTTTWTDLALNSGLTGERPATKHLNHGKAVVWPGLCSVTYLVWQWTTNWCYVDGRGHGPVWSTWVRRPTTNLSQGCWSPRRDFNLRYSECVEEELSGLLRFSEWMWYTYVKFCDGR